MKSLVLLAASTALLAGCATLGSQPAGSGPGGRQFAISANDGKQLRPGEMPAQRTADSIAVIDLAHGAPRTIGSVDAPASMIGPPAAVAVARSGRYALVSAAQRLNAAGEIELNDTVSLVDLADLTAPRVVQTLAAGPGASGTAINRAGTLALVASTGDDAITVFAIRGDRLEPAGRVQLPAKSRPTDVAFAPDGRSALIVAQGSSRLIGLTVDGTTASLDGRSFATGLQPYGVVFSPDGRYAYNTNLGGSAPAPATPPRGGRIGTVSAIDLTSGAIASVEVGLTPEHVTLSQDGRYLAVVVANGSAAPPSSPDYHPYGLLQVYRVTGTSLVRVAEAHSGAWCQGAVFTRDDTALLLQCAMTRDIGLFRFDGTSLVQDEAATLHFTARPGAIATPTSR